MVTQPAILLTSVSTAQQVPASDVVASVRLKLWVAIAASPSRLSSTSMPSSSTWSYSPHSRAIKGGGPSDPWNGWPRNPSAISAPNAIHRGICAGQAMRTGGRASRNA
jgi:hypothetical protein